MKLIYLVYDHLPRVILFHPWPFLSAQEISRSFQVVLGQYYNQFTFVAFEGLSRRKSHCQMVRRLPIVNGQKHYKCVSSVFVIQKEFPLLICYSSVKTNITQSNYKTYQKGIFRCDMDRITHPSAIPPQQPQELYRDIKRNQLFIFHYKSAILKKARDNPLLAQKYKKKYKK